MTETMSGIVADGSDGILRVQLNRPARKNVITAEMCNALAELLDTAMGSDQVRVVLWHAAGDSFSAGTDLEDCINHPPDRGDSPQARLTRALMDFDKPLVAAVQGLAAEIGTTLLLHFDFVYAGKSARFQLPFVTRALVPSLGSSYLLPSRVGYLRAAELILQVQPIDASKAADIGLITQVVPEEKLLATATEAARFLAAQPIGAVRASKRLMKEAVRQQLELAVTLEADEGGVQLRSAEAQKVFDAFLVKRQSAGAV